MVWIMRGTPRSASWLRILGMSIALAMSAPVTTAFAQDDTAKAAALARSAEDLMRDQKYGEACAKLDGSFLLDPRGSTALDLAICRDKEGKIGRAYRMYGVAADLNSKEGRNDRVATAKMGRQKLYFKVPKLKVTVPKDAIVAGLSVTINGEELPMGQYGKDWEVDPGELVVVASAPGRKSWEKTLKITERGRKGVTIPVLAVGADPKPVGKPEPKEDDPDDPEDEPEDDEPKDDEPADDDGPNEHSTNRLVVEFGAIGGFMFHDIDRGTLNELVGQSYEFVTQNAGFLQAECGDTETIPGAGDCEAFFDPAFGGIVGGQVFVGWALAEMFHLGARGFFTKRFPNGYYIGGGPSFSVRPVGPLWLGATFVLGVSDHQATLASARGTVPSELQDINGGETVDIPLENLDFTEGEVASGLLMGAAVEIGFSLLGPSPHAVAPIGKAGGFFSGAMMLSMFPTILFTGDGYAFALPAGVSYRFH